jgi:hypothetical protein
MSTDRLLERVRAASPSPAVTITDDELLARIVAAPGDPRLVSRPGRMRRRRWIGLLAAGVALLGAGGAAGAISLGALDHATPKTLFEANPAGRFPWRPGQRSILPVVIPQSVRRAAAFTVPGVGRFEWWIAISKPRGWLCGALRQPDGTWADLDPRPGDKYQISGPMPGCGNLPWHDAQGFAYNQLTVGAPRGEVWRVAYGYAPTFGHPVAVRDRISGATAPLGDGHYFAIVMPFCRGRTCGLPQPRPGGGYQLQTLDAGGGG